MKILGHRGLREHGKPYQNTKEAIISAMEEGADGVEIDVLASKDNILYLSHDLDLQIHSDFSSGNINELSEEELSEVKVGFKGDYYHIAKLSEILDLFKNQYKGKILNIEIKQKNITKILYNEIEKSGISKPQLIVSCFQHEEIKQYRQLDKEVKIGILFEEIPEDKTKDQYIKYINNLAEEIGKPIAIHPYIKSDLFDKFQNYENNFWTVKEAHQSKIQHLKDKGFNFNIIVDTLSVIPKS